MTKPQTVIVNLPFSGFYNSELSDALDSDESQWIEYQCDPDNGEDESAWPAPLRLSESEYVDLIMRATDYGVGHDLIARAYVDALDFIAGKAFGMTRPATRQRYDSAASAFVTEPYARPSIRMTFESMDSPREYNFTTDRLFGHVPLKVMRALFRRSAAEGHATLAAVIRERFTSCDGFHSFYSNELDSWLAKPLREWDHNELGTLFLAALQLAGVKLAGSPYDSESLAGLAYEAVFSGNGEESAWQEGTDWPRFERERLEARAEKLATWLETEPESAAAWRYENGARASELEAADPLAFAGLGVNLDELPWRDPSTPDLFGDPR